MTRSLAFLVVWMLLYGASPLAATRPNRAYEELQRKYEAALQEIERLRSELARLKGEQIAGSAPAAPPGVCAPSGDSLQTGNAHFLAQRYTEAIAAYTQAIETVPRDAKAYKHRGLAHAKLGKRIEVAYDFKKHGYTERNYISDPVEYSNLFHWKGPPDRWRIHFPTDPNEDEAALTRPEAMQARLKRFLPLDHDYDICGCNLYAVHQRVAKQFRRGRAILAGDSAHVNSPIGGMGLNSGVHDAFNLADKLARILRREVEEIELDRYERQRRHIAVKHTQAQTIRNKRLLEERDPAVRRRNHDELRRSAEDPELARKFLLRASLIESLREAEQIA